MHRNSAPATDLSRRTVRFARGLLCDGARKMHSIPTPCHAGPIHQSRCARLGGPSESCDLACRPHDSANAENSGGEAGARDPWSSVTTRVTDLSPGPIGRPASANTQRGKSGCPSGSTCRRRLSVLGRADPRCLRAESMVKAQREFFFYFPFFSFSSLLCFLVLFQFFHFQI